MLSKVAKESYTTKTHIEHHSPNPQTRRSPPTANVGTRSRRQPPAALRTEVPSSGGGRCVPQEILDVLLPARPAMALDEVLSAANPTGLEEASGVRFLQSNGEAGVPSPEEQNRSPRSQESQLRRTLARRLCSSPEEVQCFRAPTAEGLNRERHKAAARKGKAGVARMLPLGGSFRCRPVPRCGQKAKRRPRGGRPPHPRTRADPRAAR